MEQRNAYCPNLRHDEQSRRKPSLSELCHPSLSMAIQNQSMGNSYVKVPGNVSTLVQDELVVGGENYSWSLSGSANPDCQGYGDNATNCALSDDTTSSSWQLVQKQDHCRTYSNESSEGCMSEAPCILESNHGHPELSQSGGYLDHTAAAFFQGPADLNQLFRPDVLTPDPETPYDTRHSTINSVDNVTTQGATETFSYQRSETLLSSYPVYPDTDDSWNPLYHRVPSFDPGFTTFGPVSPSPSFLDRSSLEESRAYNLEGNMPSNGYRKTASGKGTAILKWETIVVRDGGTHRVSANIQAEPSPKPFGCRKGKLAPKTKENAKKVRQIGACWPCWLLKVQCSEGKVCERCKKQVSKCSPTAEQLCSRAGFVDYEESFFPEYLNAHFAKQMIENMLTNHTGGFTDTGMYVEMSTGRLFEPIKIHANVFIPKDSELLTIYQITAGNEEPRLSLVDRFSAPIGILGLSLSDTKEMCREHIELMVKNPSYVSQTTASDSTIIPRLLLETIVEYGTNTNHSLLNHALMLHAIQYFMSRLLTFTEESAKSVYTIVGCLGVPRAEYLSSRLLNRQIKFAMHTLHRETTKRVLEELERLMRPRKKDGWGPSFCTILLLCFCIESLQTAAETFVLCDISRCELEGINPECSLRQSFAACQTLDEYPFQRTTKLFHDIFQTHRTRQGFNPFQSLSAGMLTVLDSPTNAMVEGIYNTLQTHCSIGDQPACEHANNWK